MMTPPVFRYLTESAAVREFVGTLPSRIYRNEAPDGLTQTEYIVWSVVSSNAQNYLSERPQMDDFRVQIDCYSPDAGRCLALAEAAQFALDDKGHQVAVVADERDRETGLYRYGVDYEFWLNR